MWDDVSTYLPRVIIFFVSKFLRKGCLTLGGWSDLDTLPRGY